MNKLRRLLTLSLVLILLGTASCTKHTVIVVAPKNQKNVPPGQAKKAAGSQSAKQFAPGQQKKKN